MPRIGRPPSCTCDSCPKCRRRDVARANYQALSMEERRAWIAARDPEKVRASDSARYLRDKPKRRAANDAYQAEHVAEVNATKVRYLDRNPAKRAAHIAVGSAVRDGRLIRGECDMGPVGCSGRIEGHHEDYARQLDVRWLCDTHHKQIHVDQRRLAA